jgi:hypothetical protein
LCAAIQACRFCSKREPVVSLPTNPLKAQSLRCTTRMSSPSSCKQMLVELSTTCPDTDTN